MQIVISGQHIDTGESLKLYAEDRLKLTVEKYFDHAVSANVHFTKEGYLNTCDLLVNEGTGKNIVIKSNAQCDDVYSCFDQALTKIEKQLRKYKNKIKDHHKEKTSEIYLDAINYTIDRYTDDEMVHADNPVTIAESPTKIGTYSVSQAIMKMDLENIEALMFKNSLSDRMNMIYRRKDGNIAWVDSK